MTDPKQINVMAARNTPYARKASVTRNAGSSMIQKRIGALILALLGTVAPAFAQGTPIPFVLEQYFDNNGDPLSGGRLCSFAAGSSTLANTYTTAALSVANANPIVLNSAGRPSNGVTTVGIFLTPGTSYKFVMKDSTATTCVPDTGVTLWSIDNVSAIPTSSVNVDIDGTAGEALTAGNVIYLSDGSGSKVAGSWYKADADLYYGGALPQIGLAVNDIASGSSGSIRIAGRMDTLTGLTPGSYYFASTTAGALTATAPVMARLIGQADSTTSLVLQPNPRATPIKPRAPCGRLTLTTGTPVTVTDVTAATTVYFAPYGGCTSVSVFDGTTNWYAMDFAQVSIAVPATTVTMYDVFGYDNAGAFALELTAWTNDTTRATALTTQNGVYVKTGATTRLYLGSFRTTGVSGQTEDSATKSFLFNYYNRVEKVMRKADATASWAYTTATWRQSNAAAANQIEIVNGVPETPMGMTFTSYSFNDTGTGVYENNGIGRDSTTAPTRSGTQYAVSANEIKQVVVPLREIPPVGYHYYAMLESSQAGTGTSTFIGTGGTTAGGSNANSELAAVWIH